ncbi:hypothetical protein GCM10010965_22180 [Caldalkalibacillus thermarum]|uniref:hypothetical protein n=1 Tax=Caldalkalibacillus thermarum TaxID=296745 RepID=UPI00166DB02A|nr:hypothetical protein [Caldalkalibacillus thermarum]GGK28911.1 hypothetical protein GCM10010965_22180 [Caldalkalibacillus thermarum]
MKWQNIEFFVSKGQAILPVNVPETGDIAMLVDQKGQEHFVQVQAQTFLKQVLAYFGTDLPTLRRRYGQVIGKKKMIPLPLSSRWVLAPFNTRQPIGRQSRTGWILAEAVRGIREHSPALSELELNHYSVKVYHSKLFCQQQLRSARLVQLEFDQLHQGRLVVQENRWTYTE